MTKPIHVINLNDFQAGDIILYRPAIGAAAGNFFDNIATDIIHGAQALLKHSNGHYDTTHTAIVLKVTDEPYFDVNNKKKMIKRVYFGHVITQGFEEYSLTELDEKIIRPNYFVFRAKNPEISASIIEVLFALKNFKVEWKLKSVCKAFLNNATHRRPEAEPEISHASLCSQFIIEIIKKGVQNAIKNDVEDAQDYRLYLPSRSLPKALEAELYLNPNFDLYIYLGHKNIYKVISKTIEKQLTRLSHAYTTEKRDKYRQASGAFDTLVSSPKFLAMSDLDKAIELIRSIQPYFAVKTGLKIKQPASAMTLARAARKVGIFSRDLKEPAVLRNSDHGISSKIKI